MNKIIKFLIGMTAVAMLGVGGSQAATPKNTFVMAKDIADIITMDPAEVFELTTGEIIANVYDRIMMFEPEDLQTLVGGVAESWEVSNQGKTITFKIRSGLKFHSGNPVRAEDVAWSLQRVVKLNKTPAFIITQFGWNADNVDGLVKSLDDRTFSVTITEEFSPGLVLNALSAGVASVVDKKLVMSNEKDGDLGYEWLKSNSAGSGAYSLKTWKANEIVTLEANAGYRHGAPGMQRVILRHVAEPSSQRLLLEKGDIDMARNLTPDQVKGVQGNADIAIDGYPKGTIVYMAANAGHPILGKDKVVQAMRHLVDYESMANSFLAGQFVVHQAFWPGGLWGALEDTPYTQDVETAKKLLQEAGHGDGFEMTIHTLTNSPFPEIAQAVQANLAKGGIKANIVTLEGKTLWPKYRAREHDIILARWSPDYVDPHSNADAFAHNPDNRPEAKLTGVLAWRNAWADESSNMLAVKARNELDLAKREKQYLELQAMLQKKGPYVIMFQQNEQVARNKGLKGFVSGSNFDLVFYRNVTKQ
ncbi:MAG: ABC transporter substrate-binding protein [Gammaproteobacteria bacterium]|nr:MAG: ABC transporter substrate-binding protein [Gammaproteobacteria bacterium]UCH39322.1 MAG: ABC transporter substrate-binding protein [Gammaproteobacteria bacterium]